MRVFCIIFIWLHVVQRASPERVTLWQDRLHSSHTTAIWHAANNTPQSRPEVCKKGFGMQLIRKQNGEGVFDPETYCVTQGVELGKGGKGFIYSGMADKEIEGNVGEKEVAMKWQSSTLEFNTEVASLVYLRRSSKYIVRILGVNFPMQIFAMERLKGGTPIQHLKEGLIVESDARKVMKQVLKAIRDCNENGIAHRDIKTEQFVFRDEFFSEPIDWSAKLKLVDFGMAMRAKGPGLGNPEAPWTWRLGTLAFLAPEVVRNWGLFTKANDTQYAPEENRESFSAYAPDVWAAGVIAFRLMSGKHHPLLADRQIDDWGNIGFQEFVMKLQNATKEDIDNEIEKAMQNGPSITESARKFIIDAMDVRPKHRQTAKQLLQHDWIKNTR